MDHVFKVFLSLILPFAFGCLLIFPIVSSENGYVAGFVFMPLFVLVVVFGSILTILGFVMMGLKGRPGIWWLPPGPLIFIAFFGIAIVAKTFELGPYKEQHIVPIQRDISNYVIFKRHVEQTEIENFWKDVISTNREDGRGYERMPGIQSTMSLGKINGKEAVLFNFFENATNEQKELVYERVRASSSVEKLIENSSKAEFEREIFNVSKSPVKTKSEPKKSQE